jgi:cyclase
MSKEPYSEQEVADGVWQIAGFHGWNYGVNAAVLTGEKHAIIVDTLYQPRDARRLFKRFQGWGRELLALVNTHWHTDHTVGNSLFDGPIWASKLSPRYLKRYWPTWVGGPQDKRAAGLRLKLPDRLFARRASLNLDGEEVRLIHIPGHTPDSIGVFLPERSVFIAGDAVMMLPFVWFGDSLDSIRSLRLIKGLRPRTIVQGHGPPCSSSRLETDIRYLEKIRKAVREARLSGVSRKKTLEMPLDDFLPASRLRVLGNPWRGAHRANLERVWNETSKGR